MGLGWAVGIVSAPAALLAIGGLTTARWANRHVRAVAVASRLAAAWALLVALATAWIVARQGTIDVALAEVGSRLTVSFGVYCDSLSATMMLLIGFIGLIITTYSHRYLDGDPGQGRFYQWLSFTLGAVLLLVVSRNLVMFTGAWIATSLGLHQLLTHFATRTEAVWAARQKFIISRLGDLMLLAALVLTYRHFGSFEFGYLLNEATRLASSSAESASSIGTIGALFVLGAMTKSAQFPFHAWLPETMETPTPVSALMHAGIINAGGFLVLRLSPLVSLSHAALDALAVVGGFTAVYAAIVMSTQTSIKRQLAYSTVAQMGFMMLQCGLGAFSAALLHIIAHSLYKSYAFLTCGSVIDASRGWQVDKQNLSTAPRSSSSLLLALVASGSLTVLSAWIWGVPVTSKPGAAILISILTLAVTQLLWTAGLSGRSAMWGRSLFAAAVICVTYFGVYRAIDTWLSTSVSHTTVAVTWFDQLIMGAVGLAFLTLFAAQSRLTTLSQTTWARQLYLHASAGFHWDIVWRRWTERIWPWISHLLPSGHDFTVRPVQPAPQNG
ncbi:MAG: proton-conducting transporter membrane subunit [Pirellulales bacterium]